MQLIAKLREEAQWAAASVFSAAVLFESKYSILAFFTKAIYVCIYVYISDIHNLFHVAFGVCYVIGSNSKML